LSVTIEAVDATSDELVATLNTLLPQLSPLAAPTTREALAKTLAQPGLTLLLARDASGHIVGTATLIVYQILTGRHARLEDVVVDNAARGQGIGAALTREATSLARTQGAVNMYLTSAPHRQAAHRLYERLGFKRPDTTYFRLALRE
jgi:ribosomal protein S18 acetylase RimI-like enzyme